MIPLFLDCDPGIDDAVALGYLLCQDDVEITCVAATAGNVPAEQTVYNALGWLELAGRAEIPVHPGAELPLRHAAEGTVPAYADDTHGPSGTGYAVLPQPSATPSPVSAARAWVDAAHTHPGELIAVVTGPCTNLALALELEPELPRLLRRIFIMGGAFNHRGNTKPTTEWNTDFDPEATAMVYRQFAAAQQLPVLAPLEATESIVMTPERLERILHGAADPVWRRWLGHLAEALRFYFEFHEYDGHGYLAQIHDPYVLAAALQWARKPEASIPWTGPVPAAGTSASGPKARASQPRGERGFPAAGTSTAAVDVELRGTLTRGETVADWLGRWGCAPNAELIRSIDAEGFLNHLETTLTRGPTYDDV
ncbi:nucleoside hydrolase [Nesterenkonia muleiensis]|uniref:nucleoside hydrolase n=1 Tax=Nesterenkonia muleiensis TaxID=2282648 RepID=UPI000E735130|nr:nucleoside hydrolase [Nesterenkonia muleiensis]